MSAITCCDRKTRRQNTAEPGGVNGIDFIHVDYNNHLLYVHLFDPATIEEESIEVVDIRRNKRLPTSLRQGTNTNVVILAYVKTDETPQEGRTYRLTLRRVIDGLATGEPPDGFDPRFSEIEFTHNESVGSEVDFQRADTLAESIFPQPNINYLAKDYASFRQLILDRLATTMPQWQEVHAADLGMTLVELLAYVADRLSYQQDAVATEGYLEAARRRESIRRHARLVDYRMHEGCNSRALLLVEVNFDITLAPEDIYFMTTIPSKLQIKGKIHAESDLPPEIYPQVVCFEPLLPPGKSWKLTSDDIKDASARLLLLKGFAARQGEAAIKSAIAASFQPRSLASSEIDQVIQKLNHALANGDFANGDFLDGNSALHTRTVQRTSHLPVRYRNRALLDALFSDYISSARIDGLISLVQAHNEIDFYTWDELECWIPKGATSATLEDAWEPPLPSCGNTTPGVKGARRSQLAKLSAGDYLLLEERVGPRTGKEADANKNHRQFVRLTKVRFSYDPAYGTNQDGPHAGQWQVPLVEVEWDPADKLRFPLCVSSRKQPASGCGIAERVSVARGNIVPVDQGRKTAAQEIGTARSRLEQVDCGDGWDDAKIVEVYETFRPFMADASVTYAEPIDPSVSAMDFQTSDPRRASAQISLIGIPGVDGDRTVNLTPQQLEDRNAAAFIGRWRALQDYERHVLEDQLGPADGSDLNQLVRDDLPEARRRELLARLPELLARLREALTWHPRQDLLASTDRDQHFVVENDHRRNAYLRFGDGHHGRRPVGGTRFYATLRSGNGVRGNVGAESISNIVFRRNLSGAIREIRNPLAAAGAIAPEALREVKLHAPHKWLTKQPRASLAEDYVRLARDEFANRIQNAKAVINWVGSYWLVELAIDPLAAVANTTSLLSDIEKHLNQYRRIGHRVKVVAGSKVPVALGLTVSVQPEYAPEVVRAVLIERFSNGQLKDRSLGFFHPDRLTFGQSIHSSHIVQEAAKVAGIADLTIDFLHRCDHGPCPAAAPRAAASDSSGAVQAASDAKPLIVEWKSFEVVLDDLEIAQLDNDGHRDNGLLCLNMRGGR